MGRNVLRRLRREDDGEMPYREPDLTEEAEEDADCLPH